ncbi:MAG: hypothetical protein ACHREM_29915 [Polyangiales bacterium]
MSSERGASRFSIPPSAIEDCLERYETSPESLDAIELLVLARAFERMGCDEQALDCADRAAKLEPELKDDAVAIVKRCLGRPTRPT